MTPYLPVGKLPYELLQKIIRSAPTSGSRVLLGPGVGLDCAVLEFGDTCLVLKTEPITFASDEIGWYAVQIAANDIATTGARPKWAMFTVLLPSGVTTERSATNLADQLYAACRGAGITVIGGHTEVTHDLNRPLIITTLLGEITRDQLITPSGAQAGDVILLTKGVPIEATALLAREFPDRLRNALSPNEIETARNFLFDPGISVLLDAQVAVKAGGVTAMHDPTEGGVANALWEMAQACQNTFLVDPARVPILPLSAQICQVFDLDPMGAIASGALLLTVRPDSKNDVIAALAGAGISAAEIGAVVTGVPQVLMPHQGMVRNLPRFDRDEIAKVYQQVFPDQMD
ncbi:MAG TPA: AIR synthase family protein [Bellilinea sp.]|nr:AIR synthase family protein [Bellilinea sp.]